MPPVGTADNPCQCQHPIIDSNGKIACGEDYCAKNGKKCMKNGSCCNIPNEARTECCDQKGNGIAKDDTCCPALTEENCKTEIDTTTGCLKCVEDDGRCANGEGYVVFAGNGDKYCLNSVSSPSTEHQSQWCLEHSMSMPTIYELCLVTEETLKKSNNCTNVDNIYRYIVENLSGVVYAGWINTSTPAENGTETWCTSSEPCLWSAYIGGAMSGQPAGEIPPGANVAPALCIM